MQKPFGLRTLSITLFVIATIVSIAIPSNSEIAPLSVGYAEIDITPPLGITMPGYFETRHASGILDPLLVKALVLRQGDETLAIVALDLIDIPAPIVQTIREEVQRQTGISLERQWIHGTHTHTGATVSEIQGTLPGKVASAVSQALTNRVPETRVILGTGEEKTVAFIRRYLMKDGSIKTNPGHANPEVVRPIGTIDPTVTVLSFEKARTLFVSYGLHLDCIGGTQFSADYPYHLTQAVKERLGQDWNVLYLNGCCGNVNHINVNDPSQRSGYEESRRIGTALAQAALIAQKNGQPITVDRLGARTATVQCPARKVPSDLVDWAKQRMQEDPEEAQKRKFNEETPDRILDLAERDGTFTPAEIIAFRIGPMGIVGLPAEVFQENAEDIRRHSLLDPTLVIGLTGGSMGYLPHPRGYEEGGYEATFGSARYAPETAILWCDTAVDLIQNLWHSE